MAGRSGTKAVSSFDVSRCHSHVAGEITDFRPEDFLARREIQTFSRYVHFGFAAARMAWEDARAAGALDPDRVAVSIGSSIGASSRNISDGVTFAELGIDRVHPMCPLQYCGSLPSEVAIVLGLRGPAYSISTACTAGADATGLAMGLIASGVIDAAVVGGSEAPILPLLFHAFDRLQVISRLNDPPERASRPFSRARCGFGLAEFDTFVRHGIPVIAVVGNDAGWTQIAREQVKMLHDDVGTVLARTAYHEVARGCGAEGLLVTRGDEVVGALQRARELARQGRPVLVNVWLDRTDFREGSLSM